MAVGGRGEDGRESRGVFYVVRRAKGVGFQLLEWVCEVGVRQGRDGKS